MNRTVFFSESYRVEFGRQLNGGRCFGYVGLLVLLVRLPACEHASVLVEAGVSESGCG